MSTIASRTFANAFSDVRELLNDSGGDIFTDAMLLKFAPQVHAEIQDEFGKHDLRFGEAITTGITYAANAETLDITAVTDIFEPVDIWERGVTTEEWTLLGRGIRLYAPGVANTPQKLSCWDWVNGTIRVLPASEIRLIRARYLAQSAYPASSAVTMGGEGVYWALVYGTAAIAAASKNRPTQAATYHTLYQKRLSDAWIRASREEQAVPVRWGGHRSL